MPHVLTLIESDFSHYYNQASCLCGWEGDRLEDPIHPSHLNKELVPLVERYGNVILQGPQSLLIGTKDTAIQQYLFHYDYTPRKDRHEAYAQLKESVDEFSLWLATQTRPLLNAQSLEVAQSLEGNITQALSRIKQSLDFQSVWDNPPEPVVRDRRTEAMEEEYQAALKLSRIIA